MDREITCIKLNRTTDIRSVINCANISHIGVLDFDYLLSISEVIKLIESGRDRFYVVGDYRRPIDSRRYVVVAKRKDVGTGWGGMREDDLKYIRTANVDREDGAPETSDDDVLLRVSECREYDGWRGIGDVF